MILSSTKDSTVPLSSLSLNTDALISLLLHAFRSGEYRATKRNCASVDGRASAAAAETTGGPKPTQTTRWQTANRSIPPALRQTRLTRALPHIYRDAASLLGSALWGFLTEHFQRNKRHQDPGRSPINGYPRSSMKTAAYGTHHRPDRTTNSVTA